ncbi:MAG: SGNH/GDSL hydrolase family protein [Pyrinomonadaceae bacterium]
MRKRWCIFLCASVILLVFPLQTAAQLNIQAIDVAGDSISKGFNARSTFPCSNGDQEQYNWLTSDTHGATFCGAGSESVNSVLERLECDFGTNVFAPVANHAASGASLLTDFLIQTNGIKTYLNSQSSPRLAVVFLGHNDVCSGKIAKVNASCASADQDPNNHCRTKPEAFEREFRKGLEVLMTVPNTRIGVAAPVRASQLCNFAGKTNCQFGGSCQFLWQTATQFGGVFGSGNGICGSLTSDCSPARIADAYATLKGMRDILKRVTAEYAAIPDGGTSMVIKIGGQTIGGATKASGTNFIYSDAPWYYRFSSEQLSCCDCFHPSALGQDTIARMMKNGLICNKFQPCCKDTGDDLSDGKCSGTQRKRVYYNGLF